MPIDTYVGGVEHAVLHLLYSRFIHKFVWKLLKEKDSSVKDVKEPFQRLLTQGMVLGRTYRDPVTGKFIKPNDVTLDGLLNFYFKKFFSFIKNFKLDPAKPIETATGKPLEIVWEKMSKSKYNGVAPQDMVLKYGAD